jgi:L-aspartate oxidase
MTIEAGVLRSAESLERAARAAASAAAVADPSSDREACELRNLAEVARAVVAAATAREESRGAHTRTDFPDTVDAGRVRFVIG